MEWARLIFSGYIPYTHLSLVDYWAKRRVILRSCVNVALLQCVLLAVAPSLLAQQTSSSTWKLKNARLKVDSDIVIYEAKKSSAVTVATKSITNVCYDTVIHARGPSAGEAAISVANNYPPDLENPLGAILAAPFMLAGIGGAAAVHTTKSTRHLIILHWTPPPPADGSVTDSTSELTLEAEKGNFAALLKEFQRLTGKPWTDVSRLRGEIYAHNSHQLKLAEKEKHAPYLAIRVRSRIGNSILDQYGGYRAVLRASPSGEGDLYVFATATKGMVLMAIVHGLIRNEKNPKSVALPVYESQTDLSNVTEVKMPDQTLTVTSSQPYEYNPDCPSLP